MCAQQVCVDVDLTSTNFDFLNRYYRDKIMADLPALRVSPARLFVHFGIDYCGPFIVRESRKRNSKYSKAYIAVFVCLSCNALHLELVFDLSTGSFLNALKRFICISRRVTPSDIYTDNERKFVGAARKLKELRQAFLNKVKRDSVSDFSAQSGISGWLEQRPLYLPNCKPFWPKSRQCKIPDLLSHYRAILTTTHYLVLLVP